MEKKAHQDHPGVQAQQVNQVKREPKEV